MNSLLERYGSRSLTVGACYYSVGVPCLNAGALYNEHRSIVVPEALLPECAYQLPERWYKLPERCIRTTGALWLCKPNYRSVKNILPKHGFILLDHTCLLPERLWLQKLYYQSEERLVPERAYCLSERIVILPERLWLQKLYCRSEELYCWSDMLQCRIVVL
ncbi:hypothetical protein AMTRI_Chr09g34130 [Amborella trichopoda]|uniref:Uncharacterized protein n=1 Tax=Amborella trichopoda TaxID=13333 RepID=W1NK16_AMBTC|nr:hypothetical protein AMTR_s00001p00036500 [Amborella trichopoda]